MVCVRVLCMCVCVGVCACVRVCVWLRAAADLQAASLIHLFMLLLLLLLLLLPPLLFTIDEQMSDIVEFDQLSRVFAFVLLLLVARLFPSPSTPA